MSPEDELFAAKMTFIAEHVVKLDVAECAEEFARRWPNATQAEFGELLETTSAIYAVMLREQAAGEAARRVNDNK